MGKVVPKQFAREKLWKHYSKHNFAPALFLAALQWIVMSCFIVSNSEDAELLQLWTIGSQHFFSPEAIHFTLLSILSVALVLTIRNIMVGISVSLFCKIAANMKQKSMLKPRFDEKRLFEGGNASREKY